MYRILSSSLVHFFILSVFFFISSSLHSPFLFLKLYVDVIDFDLNAFSFWEMIRVNLRMKPICKRMRMVLFFIQKGKPFIIWTIIFERCKDQKKKNSTQQWQMNNNSNFVALHFVELLNFRNSRELNMMRRTYRIVLAQFVL